MQLRSHRTARMGSATLSSRHVGDSAAAETSTLAQLVASAAAAAPSAPAICKPGLTISFGDLAVRATTAAGALSNGSTIDDSALTIALMMTVPGLAASGAEGLAATLSSVRVAAAMAAAGSGEG